MKGCWLPRTGLLVGLCGTAGAAVGRAGCCRNTVRGGLPLIDVGVVMVNC